MRKSLSFIIIAVIIIAGIVVWLVFFRTPSQKEEVSAPSPEIETGLGGMLFESVGENPVAKMPETNPFQKEINPLKDIYKNPFE